jgi:hypothetical protein
MIAEVGGCGTVTANLIGRERKKAVPEGLRESRKSALLPVESGAFSCFCFAQM